MEYMRSARGHQVRGPTICVAVRRPRHWGSVPGDAGTGTADRLDRQRRRDLRPGWRRCWIVSIRSSRVTMV